jgi:membrane protein
MVGLTGLISGGLFAWLTAFAGPWLGQLAVILKATSWISAFILGVWGFALIMRYGPDRRPAKWRWLTPGAVIATLLWMASSFGFSLYVAYVANYGATYGSLSAIVVFLLWLYLTAYGALLGAVVNAELERQTAADSTEGPDLPLGLRGAVVADTVVTDSLTEAYLAKRKRRLTDRLAVQSGSAHKLSRRWFPRGRD